MEESDQQKPKTKKKKKVKKKKGKKEGTSSTSELNIPNVEVLKGIKDFFNQAPPKSGEQWTDDIFPPNKNSLINDSPKSNDDFECEDNDIDISEIEWKRINEIYPEPRLFSGKINAQEITNGKISSSYFLSAISALCDYPGLIKNIFINQEYNPDGYYTLVLFIDGEYKTIYLDDYFPCLKGTNIPYFTKVNNFSFWPLLLEKAWAKINSSYQNALSGWPNDIFRAFTGFACEELNHSEETPERIWRIIKTVKENNGIICTSTKIGEGINEVGLIPGISYSVINAVEVEDEKNRKIFLLKLRNDLGNSVWNGDWSENSVYWTDNIKKQIPKEEKTDKNKGEFYICLNDYISYFSRTDLCYVIYDGFKQTYDFNNISNIIYPHVFNFYLYEKSIVSISAIEKNWRFHKELRNISHPTSIIIAEYDPIKEKLQYITCSYDSYENTEKTRVLNPGHYIAWIYKSSQSEKPLPESMKIRIISSGELNLKYIGNDQNFDIIEHIIYQGIQLYKDDKITLGEIFYGVDKLTSISFCNCKLTDDDILHISNYIVASQNLLLCDISKNIISTKACSQFGYCIPKSVSLETIKMSECGITPESLLFLFNGKGSKCLKNVIINGNDFGDIGLVSVSAFIKSSPLLESIEVKKCKGTDMGFITLVNSIRIIPNSKLKMVNYQDNNITQTSLGILRGSNEVFKNKGIVFKINKIEGESIIGIDCAVFA